MSSWPLKVHPRAVMFGIFVKKKKNVHKMWLLWGTFSVNHEGDRSDISEALRIAYKAFCTRLYSKYIVYFYLKILCLPLFRLTLFTESVE